MKKQPEGKMVEIAELEQRINAALARISAGAERLCAAGGTREDRSSDTRSDDNTDSDTPSAAQAELITHLQAALDTERAARLAADAAFNEMQSPPGGASSAEVDRLTRQLDAQGLDNQRLRSSVAQLREELRRLREAAEQSIVDAPLVNRALQAELEAMRAVRAAETTEMAEILAALGPLVEAEEANIDA